MKTKTQAQILTSIHCYRHYRREKQFQIHTPHYILQATRGTLDSPCRASSSAACAPRAFVYPPNAPACLCFPRLHLVTARSRLPHHLTFPSNILSCPLMAVHLLAFRRAEDAFCNTFSQSYTMLVHIFFFNSQ